MRILITGGAGFLGSHLSDVLLQAGHSVICMDNLLTGRVENIAHLLGHERFSFVKYNVCDYLHIEGPLDAVMHFASPASPQDYLEYPIATLKVGALGTHKALGLAKAKSARFLLASTSEVYGDPLVNPQPESYWGNVNPSAPVACTTRPSVLQKPLPWPTIAIMPSIPGSCASSIHSDHACGRMTAASCRPSSFRRSRENR